MISRILTIEQVDEWVASERAAGKRIGFTCGAFDVMHAGHAQYLAEEDRPLSLILRWKPDFYIKGGDYKAGALRSSSVVEEYGGKTVLIPPQFAASTTSMFERIQALAVHAPPDKKTNGAPIGLALLDRDGTLVRDACFDPTEVELLSGVVEALLALQAAGFRLCLVSNQQGIGLGYFGYREFIDGNRKLLRELGKAGVSMRLPQTCSGYDSACAAG